MESNYEVTVFPLFECELVCLPETPDFRRTARLAAIADGGSADLMSHTALKVKTTFCQAAEVKAQNPEEYSFKILVIGDAGSGKTSIVKRYVHNLFSQHYQATVSRQIACLLDEC
ncbi:unnamed protein product, partial [Soboliphyme baturini]|uniref:Ras-related protein Rab-24 n=1 Tax=Soboliphyme baturini TaxID=241478 RepID=A0A183IYY6_9BILA